ncbi:MAG: hypothetical protein ACRD82_03105 [Blastocatellia bacterium]
MEVTLTIPDKTVGAKEAISDPALWEFVKDDPISVLLLSGEASTVHKAETKYLIENVEAISRMVVGLVASDLTDEEFARHPLILLLRGHGSRRWEDSML